MNAVSAFSPTIERGGSHLNIDFSTWDAGDGSRGFSVRTLVDIAEEITPGAVNSCRRPYLDD